MNTVTTAINIFGAHQRIFLTGMPGSGKTTLGKKLSKILNWTFFDLDEQIKIKSGKEISAIFEKEGEAYFREKEREILFETALKNHVVISCGGGTVSYKDNINWINEHGISIYLKAEIPFLVDRIFHSKTVRPLFTGQMKNEIEKNISKIFSARKPYYEESKIQIKVPVKSLESLVKQVTEGDYNLIKS